MSDLKTRTYRGAVWSAVDAIGARLVQFVIGIILARLLSPAEFGLIGMLAIFIAISQSLLSSGFVSALVQKEKVTTTDSSSVFYFNIAISVVLVSLFWLTAPLVASFYGQPLLTPMARALSLVVIVSGFSVVQSAMLTRNMDFRIQTKVSLGAGVCSGAIGIVMAYLGYGVWSLVVQQVSAAIFRTVLLWVFNSWRPRLVFSLTSLRRMFKFGSNVLASSLLSQAFQNIHYVVIGRLFTAADLGFYTRAKHMEQLPAATLTSIVSRVAFPAFSTIHTDDARLTRGLRKVLSVVMLFTAPVMVGLAVVAEPLVVALLTDTWLPSVPYLQLLCLVGLITPLHVLNMNVLMAKGRSDLSLRLDIAKKSLTLISIAIAWRWGIVALIVGQIVVSTLSLGLNTHYTRKFLGYGALGQIKDVAVYLVFALVMGIGVYSLTLLSFPGPALLLLTQIVTGFGIYLLLCCAFRPPAFLEVLSLLRSRLGNTMPPSTGSDSSPKDGVTVTEVPTSELDGVRR